jgi:DNA primase
MTSLIEQIKAKIDVVEEIGLVVALQKSGKSYKGHCPFHNERTPSFHVFAESQTWRCFGCNEGGDVFTFVEKQQGIDFRETLHYLAEKAGISVEEQGGGRDPEEERERTAAKERLRKMNEEALLWYHQVLLRARDASDARAYLQSRGVNSESVIAFSLGYAPDQWDGLSRYLAGRGYTEREMVNGGLARVREMGGGPGRPQGSPLPGESGEEGKIGGGVYDYFRNRIIFPIRDTRGRVIGFGGRVMGDGQPKYLNSPQTVLFEKNNVLYALDRARENIKLAKQVVIVEGYVDAVIAHQYGTKQTVACIGSAITEKHIQQLKNLTKQVTLALDPDSAGEAATERGIQEALKAFDRTIVPVPVVSENYVKHVRGKKGYEQRGIIRLEEQVDAEINVAQLPTGEDPDEFIRRDFKGWSQAIAHPLPLIDYYFMAKTTGLDLKQPYGKAEAAKRLLPVIGAISDRIKRDAYIQKLSTIIGIDERSLNEELQRVLRGQRTAGVRAAFTDRGEARREGDAPGGRQLLPDHRASEHVTGDVETGGDEDGISGQKSSLVASRTFGLDKRSNNRVQWEDYLIGLLLANPELSTQVCGIINDGDFAGTDTRELYRFFNSVDQRGSSPLFQSIEQAVPSALLTTIDRARKSVESRSPLDGAGLQKAAVQCATRLKRARLLQQNMELQLLMREAENAGEVEAAQQFRRRFSTIYRELRTIDSAMHLHG